MSVMIEKADILNIAIKIEENGENFYREAASKAASSELKELLNVLAKDEVKHKETFKKMLSTLNFSGESLSNEYMNYLKAYTDRLIFTVDQKELQERMNKFDQLWALDFAIQRELDSILYYYELKNVVAKKDHHILDSIIAEERSHFEKLSKIKSIIISDNRR